MLVAEPSEEAAMPQILIVTDSPQNAGEVVYRERIVSTDLESDHFSGQLVERVGWAVLDTDQLEHRARAVPAERTREPAER
jgi:hypothetical protein